MADQSIYSLAQQFGYDVVSPGEVCTIQRAKELGILNTTNYFNDDYADTKTFNAEKDNREKRSASLCKVGLDSTVAYVHCIDEYGPGYKRKPGDPATCMTYGCPPGFEQEGPFCKKEPVLKDARIDKRSRCDERWYDWFTIPNYHLGNSFHEEAVGKCWAPCPENQLPAFNVDPVDGAKLSFFAEDKVGRCVNKEVYFAGKYAKGDDYCPLAWIHRMDATNENINKILKGKQEAVKTLYGDQTTSHFNTISSDTGLAETVAEISNMVDSSIPSNLPPMSKEQKIACNSLNNKARLEGAYKTCLNYEKQTVPEVGTLRERILKQACNEVFCSEENDALDVLGKPPVCVKVPKKTEEEVGKLPDVDDQAKIVPKVFKVAAFCLMVPVVILIAYLIWRAWDEFIWPVLIRPWIFFVLRMITGRTYGEYEYKTSVEGFNRDQVLAARRVSRRTA